VWEKHEAAITAWHPPVVQYPLSPRARKALPTHATILTRLRGLCQSFTNARLPYTAAYSLGGEQALVSRTRFSDVFAGRGWYAESFPRGENKPHSREDQAKRVCKNLQLVSAHACCGQITCCSRPIGYSLWKRKRKKLTQCAQRRLHAEPLTLHRACIHSHGRRNVGSWCRVHIGRSLLQAAFEVSSVWQMTSLLRAYHEG
jgi:hypothetical protein